MAFWRKPQDYSYFNHAWTGPDVENMCWAASVANFKRVVAAALVISTTIGGTITFYNLSKHKYKLCNSYENEGRITQAHWLSEYNPDRERIMQIIRKK